MKLLIVYLTDNRRDYTYHPFINYIKKSKYKDLWELLILTNTSNEEFYLLDDSYNINHKIVNINSHNNYLDKIKFSIQYAKNNNIPYIMKCDNDVFFLEKTLDYIIDNLNILENDKYLTIGPILSSGIPTVEYFTDLFLDEKNKKELYDIYLKTNLINFAPYYSDLNKFTLYNKDNYWDYKKFYDSVKNELNHHFKGVHPVRINNEAINYINKYLIENKDRFNNNDNKMELILNDDNPYLCNNVFCIKTDIYNDIVYNNNLYVDMFDEVPLNKYANNNNKKHVYVKNGFGIHMYYNCHDNHLNLEKQFCNKFFE